jgi:hypothetical protein
MIVMKNYLLWLPVTLIGLSAAIYSPVKRSAAQETTENKSISFAVYKSNSYTSEVYNKTSVKLHITIEKVKGINRSIVWDKTFDAKLLREYPAFENALCQKVVVPDMPDKKEHLEVTYTLVYNSNGSELQMQSGTIVYGASDKVEISI